MSRAAATATVGLELRSPAASWDAIAATSRQISRSEATSIPSDIAGLDRRTRIMVRGFDLVASSMLIVVTLPLMVLVALLVAVSSRGPVLYLSWRIGRGGRIFGCVKFRTMTRDADAVLPHLLAANRHLANEFRSSHSLRHDPRVTRVGKVLRRTHLDELPQLFNVLFGRMSLVGPRPIVPKEMGLYGPSLSKTLTVKPGITGAWQVSKRLGCYAGRVETDVRYVGRRSLARDLWICVRTALLVIGIGRRPNR
ncbi:MAG: sugar transferase [Acidimicrobiales bacterium]